MSPKFNWPIVGHKNIIDFLQKSIINDRLSHAYLFYGPEHVGKETVANYFTASLLCQPEEDIAKGIHPDVYWLARQEDKKNISIDEIRQLQRRLSLSSLTGSYKVAIISNAEELSIEAANSLLKTIEEPSEKAVIILLVRHINLLPQTIHSRCRILRFLPVSKKEIRQHLKEKFNLTDSKAKNLAFIARGLPGLAITFTQSPEVLDDWMERAREFVSITKGNIVGRFSILRGLFSLDRNELARLLTIWQSVVRDLYLIKNRQADLVVNFFIKPELEVLVSKYSSLKLVSVLAEIAKTKKYLFQNINARLALENLILKF